MSFPTRDMELTTILIVKDVKKSKKFYKDVLGAKLYREYDGGAVFQFNKAWILLTTGGKPTKDKPKISLAAPRMPKKLSQLFTIRVKDCEKSYKILKKRGAKFLTPPVNWGAETRCFFRDPDGHLFEISSIK